MGTLIAFWSHALAAAGFLALTIWRVGAARLHEQKLLLAGFAVTACWAWITAVMPGEPLSSYAETARNLVWIGLLYSLSASSDERQHGVRLVYAAVAAVLGFQLVVDTLSMFVASGAVADTEQLLRVTAAAGALVLVHNLYGQASPASRSNIRLAMLSLSLMWSYDLNLYTIAYLDPRLAPGLTEWRGAIVALIAPMFALAVRREEGWHSAVARRDVPVALAARDLRLFRADGDPRDRASRHRLGLVARASDRAARGNDRSGNGAPSKCARAQLGEGQGRQASVRAPLRLSHRMAALYRDARHYRVGRAAARRTSRQGFRRHPRFSGWAAGDCRAVGCHRHGGSVELAGTEPPAGEIDGSRGFWLELQSTGRIVELDAFRGGWASSTDSLREVPNGW